VQRGSYLPFAKVDWYYERGSTGGWLLKFVDVSSAEPLELILANEHRDTARRFGLTE